MTAKLNKGIVVGGAAAVLGVALIGGYFYAAGAGVERFEDYLYENDLEDAIRYREIAYSPLSDTLTLEDVDLELDLGPGKLTGHLDSLEFIDASEEDGLQLRFAGYRMISDPTPDEVRDNMLYQITLDQQRLLRQVGIEETVLSGEIDYRYDRDDDRLALRAGLDAENVAAYAGALELERARRLVDIRPADLQLRSLTDIQKLMDEFGRIEFASMEAEIEDHGFLERRAYLETLSGFNYAAALNGEEPVLDAVAFRQNGGGAGREPDLPLDKDSTEALNAFLARGGDLEIHVETDRPVRFNDLFRNEKLNRAVSIEIER
ncbi:MAG TPA: hypothetical protein VK971_09645 [Thiohalobacter sp.]|nr:hypothetical protein [Thiohalobacter sp.]